MKDTIIITALVIAAVIISHPASGSGQLAGKDAV